MLAGMGQYFLRSKQVILDSVFGTDVGFFSSGGLFELCVQIECFCASVPFVHVMSYTGMGRDPVFH